MSRMYKKTFPIFFYIIYSHLVHNCEGMYLQQNNSLEEVTNSIINANSSHTNISSSSSLEDNSSNSSSDDLASVIDSELLLQSRRRSRHIVRPRISIEVSETQIQQCGDGHKDAVRMICNKTFYRQASRYYGRRRTSIETHSTNNQQDGTAILRRMPREIIDQCCKKSCNRSKILKYCDTESTTTTTSTTTSEPTTQSSTTSSPNSLNFAWPSFEESTLEIVPSTVLSGTLVGTDRRTNDGLNSGR